MSKKLTQKLYYQSFTLLAISDLLYAVRKALIKRG